MVSLSAVEDKLLDDSMYLIASDSEDMSESIADPAPSLSAEPSDYKPGMDAELSKTI